MEDTIVLFFKRIQNPDEPWVRARFNAIVPAGDGLRVHLHDGMVLTDRNDSDSYRVCYPQNEVTQFPIWLFAGDDAARFNKLVLEQYIALSNRLKDPSNGRWHRVVV